MLKAFITVDLEEWFHLEYLQKYSLDRNELVTIEKSISFFEWLSNVGIKATVFVLGEVAEKRPDLVRILSSFGHSIGCHGLSHRLLTNIDNQSFKEETVRAKESIEQALCKEIIGYRAPCFSIDNGKLNTLSEIGFKYDSSYIKFKQHEYYGDLDLGKFQVVTNGIYKKERFIEFEIPTISIGNYQIPFSGGGYLRLLPEFVSNRLINNYLFNNQYLLIYLHPFELSNIRFSIKGLQWKDNIRLNVGRKDNSEKVTRLITKMSQLGAKYFSLDDECNSIIS